MSSATSMFPYLSAAIWIPILFGFLVLLVGNDRNAGTVRLLALVGALAGFAATIPLFTGFDRGTADFQFVESTPWIERLSVNYHLGVDGLSVWFVLLTAFITIFVVIAAWE
ncbi:MAG: NADH-quinone oxidoreductase subunit M, partial [Gammaproteobacteria bacterium]